jgi:CpXC protein
MDVSYAVWRTVACIDCGAHLDVQVWRIIDAEHRPDLIARVTAKLLRVVVCPHCGGEGMLDEPLLIWQPGREPPLLYAPSTDSTLEQVNKAGFELIALLRERVGVARGGPSSRG